MQYNSRSREREIKIELSLICASTWSTVCTHKQCRHANAAHSTDEVCLPSNEWWDEALRPNYHCYTKNTVPGCFFSFSITPAVMGNMVLVTCFFGTTHVQVSNAPFQEPWTMSALQKERGRPVPVGTGSCTAQMSPCQHVSLTAAPTKQLLRAIILICTVNAHNGYGLRDISFARLPASTIRRVPRQRYQLQSPESVPQEQKSCK